jgi:hypothetical protein
LRKRFFAPEWVFIFGIGRLLKQTDAGTEAARRPQQMMPPGR